MTPLLAISLTNIGYVLAVVLGIGFLIFIHELGHFLAAKAAGVRVDAFAIGMGPRILGWQRGDTDYKLCLLPIGGYVRMHGEFPGEGDPNDPRNLLNQPFGWRLLIYSGGIIMNLLVAFVVFPIVFNSGVPFGAPVVGSVDPGSPAWFARLQPGDRIVEIDGKRVYSMQQLLTEGALSGDDGLELVVQRGEETFARRIVPEFAPSLGLKTLGIRDARESDGRIVALRDGDNAARAAGLKVGDRILRWNGHEFSNADIRELERRATALEPDRSDLELIVQRGEGEAQEEVALRLKSSEGTRRLGVVLPLTRVVGQRPFDDVGLEAARKALDLRDGDVVLGVLDEQGGDYVGDRDELRARLARAKSGARLVVLRAGTKASASGAPRVARPVPGAFIGPGADSLVEAIGLAADGVSGRVRVQKGLGASQAGLVHGDRILTIDGEKVGNWSDLVRLTVKAREAGKTSIAMRYESIAIGQKAPASKAVTVSLTPAPSSTFGFIVNARTPQEVYRVDGLGESLQAGWACSIDTLRNIYATLKRMIGGTVSAEHLGGIITISVVSFDNVQSGWQRFLYFLAILSLNLAVINMLPIPILDGGQILFLCIEKLKGSPVSARTMTYAQLLGVVVVVGLLIFVTFNDIMRLLR